MASSIASNPADFTCILLLNGHFAAVHATEGNTQFISEHPTKEYRVAQAAAEAFASLKHIPFQKGLQILAKPLFTIIKTEKGWLPAQISSNSIIILSPSASLALSVTKEAAIEMAKTLAKQNGSDFTPDIGISMAEEKDQ